MNTDWEIGKGREAGYELLEMGVHYFDEMDFLMGGIEWVHAQISYQGHSVTKDDIMHSSKLCTTDRRDNGMAAGDTMMIHLGGPNGVVRYHRTLQAGDAARLDVGSPLARRHRADYGKAPPEHRR